MSFRANLFIVILFIAISITTVKLSGDYRWLLVVLIPLLLNFKGSYTN
ncbi:MAG: hypothetical protein ACOC5T_00520 [Elusimicrobiota bacterium]